MSAIESKYQTQIEVESLWLTTINGGRNMFVMLPFSLTIVMGLWDSAPRGQLLAWFGFSAFTHVFRWSILLYYRPRKHRLAANVNRFKMLALLGGAITSLGWVAAEILFLDVADPVNVLFICLPPILQAVGAMLTWFAYFPAVLALSMPSALVIGFLLLHDGGMPFLVSAIVFFILPVLSYNYSQNIANMLNRALELNFENAALRQESEDKSEQLETALENMGQGIAMSDKHDALRMWNKHFSQLLVADDSTVHTNMQLAELLNAATPPVPISVQGATQYHPADGRVYEIRQVPLALGGRVITFTDISDLIKREIALESARKDAERANAAKTRFLASASHDLRQPIHALGLFFGELSERVRDTDTAQLIDQIDDSIAAINSMLNALLDVSKLDAGVVKPDWQPCSLADIFARLNAEFQPLAQENANVIRFRPCHYWVETDPAMLERMLRNLIGNALRYTEHGRVLVGARWRGAQVEIQVLDSGHGIPEDQLSEVFMEFHQLHNPGRNRQQGLGLGLAIVKRLGRLLHHRIAVKSSLGKGSCFSITIPLAAKRTHTGKVRENQPTLVTAALQDKRILLLDDDDSVLASMSGLLSRWGCEVISARSHEDAIRQLANCGEAFDLLISDYRLADGLSGIKVARDMLHRLEYRFAVLIITGDTDPERLREAEGSGFPLLHKPVHPAKLRAILQHLLGKKMG